MTSVKKPLFPLPENANLAGNPIQAKERLKLTMRNGIILQGEFHAFETGRQSLKILITDEKETTEVQFRELKILHLPTCRQLNLEKKTSPTHQKFNIFFKDGNSLHGETLEFHWDSCGIYLYPLQTSNCFTCMFIPHAAIRQYEIGPKTCKVESPPETEAAIKTAEFEKNKALVARYQQHAAIVSIEELEHALELQKHGLSEVKLGNILVQEHLINEDQLRQALEEQTKLEKPLGEILMDHGYVSKLDIYHSLAMQLGIPFVDLSKFPIDMELNHIISERISRKYQVLPIHLNGNHLVVAEENPMDYKIQELLRFHTNLHIEPVMAAADELAHSIELVYTGMGLNEILPDEYLWEEEPEPEPEETKEGIGGVIVKLVNKMIADAHQQEVSDIHIEPYGGKEKTVIRFRKDGILRKYYEVPSELRSALIARIKVMADLDISERRIPQDGKINFGKFSPIKIELRVATLPTAGGQEDVVLRILGASKPMPLNKLQLDSRDHDTLLNIINHPYGMFLVCGPTGSGKTTTLHSILGHLNIADRKIWTAEDPVEITQKGLRQVQMKPKIGLTFASAMRSFLRADPDIIMVGEMRDKETTHIGIEASLTGHLVLSTLHTNSAPESILRLLDMGMNPFNFSDALLGILAQRLARTLCPECKQAYTASEHEIHNLVHEYCSELIVNEEGQDQKDRIQEDVRQEFDRRYADGHGVYRLFRAKGCDTCNNNGYLGRIGIYELLDGTDTIKKLIVSHAPVSELRATALREGMRTLKQDGIKKVLQGYTDIQQIRKVCMK